MTSALSAAFVGFGTALALIFAIGAQNAFVLRQGLVGRHVLPVVLVCALSDAVLITVGVAGMGALVQDMPWLDRALRWGGAAFLVVYGFLRARAALQGGGLEAAERAAPSLRAAVGTAIALTWLNPHVYLDTVALVGAVSTGFEGEARLAFGLGAISASFVFFFSLGFGARFLVPIFRSPRAWSILDAGIALLMWGIAAALVFS